MPFGYGACHILCLSQKSLTAATVSFRQFPSLQERSSAYSQVSFARHRASHKSTPCFHEAANHTEQTFLHLVSRQKFTRCQYLCSPAKPSAALRIFAGTLLRLFHATQKSCTVRPGRYHALTDRPSRWHSQETRIRYGFL